MSFIGAAQRAVAGRGGSVAAAAPSTPSLPGCIGDESLKPAAHGHVHPQHQRDPDQQRRAAHQEPRGLEHEPASSTQRAV